MKEKILDKYYKPKMHWKSVNRQNVLNAMEAFARLKCEEQKRLCINEIIEESKDDPLIYEQTEAIRNLVKNAPEPKF